MTMTNKTRNQRKEQSLEDEFWRTLDVKELNCYFFNCHRHGHYDIAFELEVVKRQPELYVQAVRATKSFLKEERYWFFKKEVVLPENLSVHKRVWDVFYQIEHDFQMKIPKEFEHYLEILPENKEDAFFKAYSDVVCWIESIRFRRNESETIVITHACAPLYGMFMEMLLRNSKFKTLTISDRKLCISKLYENMLLVCKEGEHWQKGNRLFPLIYQYLEFQEDVLDLYCYDMTVSPEIINGRLFLKQPPIDYYRWKMQDARYALAEHHYREDAEELEKELVDTGKMKIKGADEVYQTNIDLNADIFKTFMFFDDLKIPSFKFEEKEIPIGDIISPLYGLAANKSMRYEGEIVNMPHENWFLSMEKLRCKSILFDKEMSPFTIIGEDEFLEMYKDDSTTGEFHKELVRMFSYPINKGDFEWGRDYYDVYRKPFIKLGKMLVCPSAFLARNTWLFTFYRAMLENLAMQENGEYQKQCSGDMEKYVEQLFKEKNSNWKAYAFSKDKNRDGDVDVYVESDDTILLIQLKRTKLRTTLAGAYFDWIEIDRKAAGQLNKFEVDNPNHKKIFKWIVSTSYAKCLQEIDGVLKVNYFDLIYNLKTLKYNDLRKFIAHIENDDDMRNICENYRNVSRFAHTNPYSIYELALERDWMSLPMKTQDPSIYNIPIYTSNEHYIDFEQYRKALELEEKGKRRQAIKILEILTHDFPDFYNYWSSLANMYAEEKQFEKAIACYEKSLQIIPEDPWILHNYAVTYNEAKKFDKYADLRQLLKTQYWFIDFC